mmetsp:Transcript_66312/g.183112  ORF Transcript_66312/g.183112 Transcript_66312/m.183112 type:complete len:322 (-) Transcript_66312:418-1383(-)
MKALEAALSGEAEAGSDDHDDEKETQDPAEGGEGGEDGGDDEGRPSPVVCQPASQSAHKLEALSAALSEGKLSLDIIEKVIEARAGAVAPLREGTEALVKFVARHSIPTLLFSEGVRDLALQILLAQIPMAGAMAKSLPPTLKLIANPLTLSPPAGPGPGPGGGPVVTGLELSATMPPSHTLPVTTRTKNVGTALTDPTVAELVARRQNVLLVGSNPSEASMAQGMTSVGGGPEATVLKVGYLDLTQPDLCGRLAAFESNGFDAVVVGEGSLNYVNDFLTEVATGVAPGAPAQDGQQHLRDSQMAAQAQAANLHLLHAGLS